MASSESASAFEAGDFWVQIPVGYGAPLNPIFLTILHEMAWKGAPVDFYSVLVEEFRQV